METDEKGLVKCPYRWENTVSGMFSAWAEGTLAQHRADIDIVNQLSNPYAHANSIDYHTFEDARLKFLAALKAEIK